MSDFREVLDVDPARVVVKFHYAGPGMTNEEFEWGIVGSIPILPLVGKLCEVQHCLWADPHDDEYDCPEQAVVIVWIPAMGSFKWYVHKDTPVDSMVGMLEVIKTALTTSRMGMHASAQQRILGPDGRPMR